MKLPTHTATAWLPSANYRIVFTRLPLLVFLALTLSQGGGVEFEGMVTQADKHRTSGPDHPDVAFPQGNVTVKIDRIRGMSGSNTCQRVGDTRKADGIRSGNGNAFLEGRLANHRVFAQSSAVGQRAVVESDASLLAITTLKRHEEGKITHFGGSSVTITFVREWYNALCKGGQKVSARGSLGKVAYNVKEGKRSNKTFNFTAETEFRLNGKKADKSQVLEKGRYILIYPPREQTFRIWTKKALTLDWDAATEKVVDCWKAGRYGDVWIKERYENSDGKSHVRVDYIDPDGNLVDAIIPLDKSKFVNSQFMHLDIKNKGDSYNGLWEWPGRRVATANRRCGDAAHAMMDEGMDDYVEGWIESVEGNKIVVNEVKQARVQTRRTLELDSDAQLIFHASRSDASELVPGRYVQMMPKRGLTIATGNVPANPAPRPDFMIRTSKFGGIISKTPLSAATIASVEKRSNRELYAEPFLRSRGHLGLKSLPGYDLIGRFQDSDRYGKSLDTESE